MPDIILNPDQAQWDDVLKRSLAPSPNQTWEWGEAMATIRGIMPIRLLAMRDGTPVGVLQAFAWTIGPLCMAVASGESGDGGGPVIAGHVPEADRSNLAGALLRTLVTEAKKRGALKLTISTSPELSKHLPPSASVNVATKWTPVLELLEDEEKMLNTKVDQKVRNQISKSEKNGVIVREGSRSDLAAYRSIQSALTARKRLERKSLNTLKSLEHVWDALAPKNMIKLWLAHKEGRVVGGALILYAGRGLLYRSGVLTEEGRTLYAGNALQWAIITHAIRRGYRTYNLCGAANDPSDPLYGITKFKLSFGAEVQPFLRYSAAGNRVVRFLAYRLCRIVRGNEWFPLLIYP